jgi:hypothetical protein
MERRRNTDLSAARRVREAADDERVRRFAELLAQDRPIDAAAYDMGASRSMGYRYFATICAQVGEPTRG